MQPIQFDGKLVVTLSECSDDESLLRLLSEKSGQQFPPRTQPALVECRRVLIEQIYRLDFAISYLTSSKPVGIVEALNCIDLNTKIEQLITKLSRMNDIMLESVKNTVPVEVLCETVS